SLLGTAMSLGTAVLGRFDASDPEVLSEFADDLAAMRAAGVDFDTQREAYEARVQAGQGAFRLYFRHYRTADGLISVAGLSAGLFAKFHEVTGLPDVDRSDHTAPAFQAVVDAAEELFTTRTTDEWIAVLQEAGYPCSPYHLPYEALDDEQVRANDFVVDLDHPIFGRYTTTGMPVRFEKSPSGVAGPSPTFAAHTAEVLGEAGLSSARIAELATAGVVVDGSGSGSGPPT
ncbi:MAG: CoA transferase, partial [Actinomycetota bacterium]